MRALLFREGRDRGESGRAPVAESNTRRAFAVPPRAMRPSSTKRYVMSIRWRLFATGYTRAFMPNPPSRRAHPHHLARRSRTTNAGRSTHAARTHQRVPMFGMTTARCCSGCLCLARYVVLATKRRSSYTETQRRPSVALICPRSMFQTTSNAPMTLLRYADLMLPGTARLRSLIWCARPSTHPRFWYPRQRVRSNAHGRGALMR